MSTSVCTCHQCSGDSWDCPEHYSINSRFREAKRLLEIGLGERGAWLMSDIAVKSILRRLDKKQAAEDAAFWKERFAELDRRGL